jgi:hypothetical protein
MTSENLRRVSVNSASSDGERVATISGSKRQRRWQWAEVGVEAAEVETVGNDGKQVVTAVNRRQQR